MSEETTSFELLFSKETHKEKRSLLRHYHNFFNRGLKVWLGYRILALLNVLEIFIIVFLYLVFSQLIPSSEMYSYGGSYFYFVIIGLCLYEFINGTVYGMTYEVGQEQMWGTLELLFSAPVRYPNVLLGVWIFNCAWAVFYTSIALVLAFVFTGGPIMTLVSFISGCIIIFLSVTSHLGIGFMSAGISLLTKKGDPVTVVYGWVNRLVSGVLFPIALLPISFQLISYALPLTYALDGVRLCFLSGYDIFSLVILQYLVILFLFTAVLFPLGLLVFRKCYNKARQNGVIGQY